MDLEATIEALWEATRQGIYYPPEWRGKLSLEEGYRVQLGLLERSLKLGETQSGWKVGLTAEDIRQQLGFHEPVFGFLLKSTHRRTGTVLAFDELLAPCFENELCVTLDRPLQGPGVITDDARAAIATVAPALEIVERRGDFAADPPLGMADNVQQKWYVTGPAVPVGEHLPPLSEVAAEIFINGESVAEAMGSAVLGDPAASVAWLANKLAEFDRRIEPGMHIMTGSLTRQFPIAQGDLIEARFEPIGTVTAEFT